MTNLHRLGAALIGILSLLTVVSPASAEYRPPEVEKDCSTATSIDACTSNGSVGDFDGNGTPDNFRIVSDPESSNNLVQIQYDRAGSWTTVNKTNVVRSQTRIADFDGDGKDDVFVKWPSGRWGYLSEGKGSWVIFSRSKNSIASLRFKDFDGDNRADVARYHDGSIEYVPTGDPLKGWTYLDGTSVDGPSNPPPRVRPEPSNRATSCSSSVPSGFFTVNVNESSVQCGEPGSFGTSYTYESYTDKAVGARMIICNSFRSLPSGWTSVGSRQGTQCGTGLNTVTTVQRIS